MTEDLFPIVGQANFASQSPPEVREEAIAHIQFVMNKYGIDKLDVSLSPFHYEGGNMQYNKIIISTMN